MDKLGLKEGEVISHSMVTSSIERAQKKVQENNFGIRKRLLEYDNVMNSQREVIYKRRKNALFGERLQLDILTMLYDTCDDLVGNGKAAENLETFKINVLSVLGFDFNVAQEEFTKADQAALSERLYDEALKHYQHKNKAAAEKVYPIVLDVYKTRGATIENILVPFTDGVKQIGVSANLKKCIDTKNGELIKAMEKMITLAIIDQQWKEHLRDMDDLKQSVQNAVYEQKDPLLIYKFEGFEAFKRFIAKVNEETISFLLKADVPLRESDQVQEARTQKRLRLREQKEESRSLLDGSSSQPQGPERQTSEKVMPVKSEKVAGRNDKVTVQYPDGRVLKDVKFKKVEDDVKAGRCIVIEG
jgi:preprotein translocase subunit SecA